MSGGDDEGLLKLLFQTNCCSSGLQNPYFLPFPMMWLWVVLPLKSRLLAGLSIWTLYDLISHAHRPSTEPTKPPIDTHSDGVVG